MQSEKNYKHLLCLETSVKAVIPPFLFYNRPLYKTEIRSKNLQLTAIRWRCWQHLQWNGSEWLSAYSIQTPIIYDLGCCLEPIWNRQHYRIGKHYPPPIGKDWPWIGKD